MNTNLEKEIFDTKVNRNRNCTESLKSYKNVIPYQNQGLRFTFKLSHSRLSICCDFTVFHTEANNLEDRPEEK